MPVSNYATLISLGGSAPASAGSGLRRAQARHRPARHGVIWCLNNRRRWNLLFLCAVHPYERTAMTTVFASFREVTHVGPPVVCSVLLAVFKLSSVFVGAGAVMLASSALCGRIPRRL